MRVGFHSPLPPERSGIADYSFELLEELRQHVDLVAVVRDDLVGTDRAPEGVEVVGLSSCAAEDVDVDVYQMGNNPRYHRFLYARALERPGLLVLHDPSLADYHAEMCRSPDSGVFRQEIAFDHPGLAFEAELPLVDVGLGQRDLDRLEVLLARRMVEASVRTLVHSSAIAGALRARYPGTDVATIQLPAPVVASGPTARGPRRPGEVVFGVFGGINYYKRIDAVVEAFRQVQARWPLARLVIAGRPDDREMTARLRRLSAEGELGGALEVKTELTLAELEAEMTACDVAVSLRWPTAGEMSATLMRAFGAGRPAVVTDVLQFRELDERFCWRVPVGEDEVGRLVEVLSAAAADPEACTAAGEAARRFVEAEATYAVVSEQYVGHLEECAHRRKTKAAQVSPLSLAANAVLGVSVLEVGQVGTGVGDAMTALSAALRRAGVDVARLPVAEQQPGPVERLTPARVVASRRALAAARKSAARSRRARQADGPPRRPRPGSFRLQGRARTTAVEVGELHDVVLCQADARGAVGLGPLLRDHHRRGRRTVALLAPEALPLARAFDRVLRHADEIWVPSRFAADLLAGTPTAPVVVVPVPVVLAAAADPPAPPPGGGSTGPMRVVVVADAAGGLARSNPLGAVAAFAAAFGTRTGGSGEACLELVARDLGEGRAADELLSALEPVGGRLVRADEAGEVRGRIAGADVLVSLHRSDPTGGWCLEAMAAGKPVVGTAYGGWMDTATASCACLVGYDALAVSEGDFYLDEPGEWGVEPGQRWAAPDLAQAAGWLRRLAGDRRLRARLGEAARRSVAARADEAAVGKLLRGRLESLAHRAAFDEAKRKRREARLAWASATAGATAGGGRR